MKRILTMAAVAGMLAMAPQSAGAQFFKKLGKAIEKVGKSLDSGTSSSSSSSSLSSGTVSTADGCRIVCNVPNMKIEYKGLTVEFGQWHLNFVMTNTGSEPYTVIDFGFMKNFDTSGNEYDSRSVVGKNMTSLGNDVFTFEPGVPMKGKIILLSCPLSVKEMSLMQIRTRMFDPKKGYEEKYIEFRNVKLVPTTIIPESALSLTTYCLHPQSNEYNRGYLKLSHDGDYVQMSVYYQSAKTYRDTPARKFVGIWKKDSSRIEMYETTGMDGDKPLSDLYNAASGKAGAKAYGLDFNISTGYFSFGGDKFDSSNMY